MGTKYSSPPVWVFPVCLAYYHFGTKPNMDKLASSTLVGWL